MPVARLDELGATTIARPDELGIVASEADLGPPPTVIAKPWEVSELQGFSPDAAIIRGIINSKAGMFSSFESGRAAWLELTKRPTIRGMISVISPVEAFVEEAARRGGVQEQATAAAADYKSKIIPAPEASISSVIADPTMAKIGNWFAYQLGSIPAQVGPGILAALAGGLVGGAPGANLMAASTSYAQNMGELNDNLVEKGLSKEDAALYAAAGAIPMAMLDTPMTGWFGGKIAKKLSTAFVDHAIKEVAKKSLVKQAAKVVGTAALGALGEGSTEALQEVIATGVESGTTGEAFLTPENQLRWLDNFLAGTFMGGAVGGVIEAMPQLKFRGKSLEDFRQADVKRQAAIEQAKLIDPAVDPAPIVEQSRQEEFVETEASRKYWQAQEQRDLESTRKMLMEEEELTRAEEEAGGTLLPREPAMIPEERRPQNERQSTEQAGAETQAGEVESLTQEAALVEGPPLPLHPRDHQSAKHGVPRDGSSGI